MTSQRSEYDAHSSPLVDVVRTANFWARATNIYSTYKLTQLKALFLRLGGKDEEYISATVWDAQHTWAGQQMYDLCVDLRGFYLKAGQFIGARGDFVPEQICRKLCLLHDRVPPMAPERAASLIRSELGIDNLGEVFEWIELQEPLGSASISQVHKAKLRGFSRQELRHVKQLEGQSLRRVTLQPGQDAWSVCNRYGVTLQELAKANKGVNVEALQPGSTLAVPVTLALDQYSSGSSSSSSRMAPPYLRYGAVAALAHATAVGSVPASGLVAVKVQYPDAQRTMARDLVNLRAAAAFLSKTEIKFDMVSAVDELQRQIHLEFDFKREAKVMDTIAGHLRKASRHVVVPRSVPGLVTDRVLVMEFVEGVPLMQLKERVSGLPEWKRKQAAARILGHVSEAYGRMILGEGLFQADGHPGNILVRRGGTIALLDYGQSKQLTVEHRLAFARVVQAINRDDEAEISRALWDLGVVTDRDDTAVRAKMGVGMFDTRGKVDPFDKDSPIKQLAIERFPPDLFFVLRVIQLLRGLADGMGVTGFSTAQQWAPLAKKALKAQKRSLDSTVTPLAAA